MEQERLKFAIGRFDHYCDSVNNKCTVFLTLSTFIVGGLIAGYPVLLDKVECGGCTHLLMSTLLILGLAIMIIVSKASIPYTKGKSNSLLFYGDIADIPLATYAAASTTQDAAKELQDLREQSYYLAKGLKCKFRHLQIVGYLMIIQFALFVPLFIIIICNLKN